MAQKHKHHIIPRYMGGSDEPDNIVELTVEEHSKAHLELYEKYGNKEDLCAHYMLSGRIEEFRSIYSSLGAVASQKKRRERGFNSVWEELPKEQQERLKELIKNEGMKFWENITPEQHAAFCKKRKDHSVTLTKEYVRERGRKGGERCRERGTGSCFDPMLLAIARKAGGKAQGKINAESGHLAKISRERAAKIKSGELVYEPWVTITNGIISKRMNKKEFEQCGAPEGFRRGKHQKRKVEE